MVGGEAGRSILHAAL